MKKFVNKTEENSMKKYLYLLGSAMACLFVIAACSNGGGSSGSTVATTTCTANMPGCGYASQYGVWIPQGTCQSGYGMYNSTCVIVTGGGYGVGGYGQQCPIGQVQTQYGCLSQGGCPAGQAYYNGQCVLATVGGVGGYYGQQGYYGQGYQTGLYGSAYYNYPVSTYPYGYGYSGGYGYGYGCQTSSHWGGLLTTYTCY